MKHVSDDVFERLRVNRERVLARVEDACARAGRPASSVRLVAVTKAVGPEIVRALVALGQLDLGENRPEAAPAKAAAVGLGAVLEGLLRWHMIGHYQSRKIRSTLSTFSMVHSVHSEELHSRLDHAARDLGIRAPVLFQINLAHETSKQGFSHDGVADALERGLEYRHCPVEGLMTMAPFDVDSATLRKLFSALRELRDRLSRPEHPLPELSMGMSQDFEEAILEGATIVRIGSALLEGIDPGPAIVSVSRRPMLS